MSSYSPAFRAASPCPSPSPSTYNTYQRDSASPSPATQIPVPISSPSFHVPGPSSRFNQRERTRPTHYRHKSNYTPQGPVLSTEKRAHERAQSYAGKSFYGVASPTPISTGDCAGPSPLGRMSSFPGENIDSAGSRTMASSISSFGNAPVTPARAAAHRRSSSLLQDSPFSDYFTDDARSLESQTTPTSETQRLLVRLNKLQSQLMRGENAPEMLNIVGRRIGEIEDEVEALFSQNCLPEEMEEEEEEEDEFFTEQERNVVLSSRPVSKRQRQRSNPLGINGMLGSFEEEELPEPPSWDKARQDKLLAEAQTALHFLTKAQEQLKQRHQELVNLNEEYSLDMEEKEMEVERLRSENESLKSDLGFDHSELLFLELQLKSLEVECEDSMYHPKLERLQRQMENWRDDWRDVEARFKKRRARYGVTLHNDKTDRNSAAAGAEGDEDEDEPNEWKVEVKKQGTKRVNSLTIRRVSQEKDSESEDQQRPGEKDEEPTPTKSTASDLDSTPKPRIKPDPQNHHKKQQTSISAIATPKPNPSPSYTSTATQTETTPPPSPTLTPVSLAEALGLDDSNYSPGIDDCAITTSPSSHADEDDEEESDDENDDVSVKQTVRNARTEQKRNALRELWSGLTDWAGMGDDDDW